MHTLSPSAALAECATQPTACASASTASRGMHVKGQAAPTIVVGMVDASRCARWHPFPMPCHWPTQALPTMAMRTRVHGTKTNFLAASVTRPGAWALGVVLGRNPSGLATIAHSSIVHLGMTRGPVSMRRTAATSPPLEGMGSGKRETCVTSTVRIVESATIEPARASASQGSTDKAAARILCSRIELRGRHWTNNGVNRTAFALAAA